MMTVLMNLSLKYASQILLLHGLELQEFTVLDVIQSMPLVLVDGLLKRLCGGFLMGLYCLDALVGLL